jgi:hypothetical protein
MVEPKHEPAESVTPADNGAFSKVKLPLLIKRELYPLKEVK